MPETPRADDRSRSDEWFKTPRQPSLSYMNLQPSLRTLLIVAVAAARAAGQTAPAPITNPERDEIIKLSPFEVTEDTRGYYAANAMSGTRLNSKLEDLAAAISVVTKEQMQDFGLLDMNDIFNYEANTEGTGNYTDFDFNLSGMPVDNVQMDPQVANRIRGLKNANTTVGNFETSGRTPIDPINIDAAEISRGPNSSIFGIGSPAGTLNTVPAAANLRRDSTIVSVRADTRDGWRLTADLNRVLMKDTLAVRGSVVKQHDGFELKPSGFDTVRYNGMVRFHPFKRTTLSASYEYYQAHGNRPNAVPPRDGISGWLAAGAPTWDPITATARINGVVVTTNALQSDSTGLKAYITQNGLELLAQGAGSGPNAAGFNTPIVQGQTQRRLMTARVDPSGVLAAQPLLPDYPTISDRSLYDWSSLNIAAQNRFQDESNMMKVLLEQGVFETARQRLDLQFGWFRELSDRYKRDQMGGASASQGFSSRLSIDMNERLLDGQPNPYFLRPYIYPGNPMTFWMPLDRNTYRGQLAYAVDMRRETGIVRWLGMHRVSGYAEYKDIKSRRAAYRDVVAGDYAWSDRTTLRGSSAYELAHRYYLGDNQGYNVDYAPTAINPGRVPLRWGNALTGQFVTETVEWSSMGATSETPGTNPQNNNWTILKSQGAVLQSFLLKDRVITTIGERRDQRYTRNGGPITFLDGMDIEWNSWHSWAQGDWSIGKGTTRTGGVVLKPLRWLHVHGNKSDSFTPDAIAYSLYRRILPDPTGEGEDYGITLNLFGDKLLIRVNRYKTLQINARNGDSGNIAQRGYRLDFASATGSAYNLQRQATLWIQEMASAQGVTLTQDQLNQRLADTMKLPLEFVTNNPPRASALDDITARGTEIEAHYNPMPGWTMKFNATERETINAGLAAEVTRWLSDRLAAWQTIIDPRVNRPWFTEPYGGATAQSYYNTNVRSPLKIAQALQGKRKPQDVRYAANFSTSFALANITDQRWLKRVNVGGSMRWQDKRWIGYWGVESLPAIIEDADVNRPIYDKARANFDAFASYRTRLFSDKVGLTVQLNVRNLQESKARLQPIRAEVDGSISAYRIIDPRMFILTATFSM